MCSISVLYIHCENFCSLFPHSSFFTRHISREVDSFLARSHEIRAFCFRCCKDLSSSWSSSILQLLSKVTTSFHDRKEKENGTTVSHMIDCRRTPRVPNTSVVTQQRNDSRSHQWS
jgi:hypothetical protein